MSETSRRRLPRSVAFWVSAAALIQIIAAAGSPAPLYPVFQETYDISAGGLTAAFGLYIVGVASCLLFFGRVSDHLGRRPTAIAAILAAICGCVLLEFVSGAPSLGAARFMQGLAVGLGTSAISTFGFELGPALRPWLAPTIFGSGAASGIAIGAFVSGVFVQYLPHPFTLFFDVQIALLISIGICVLLAPETRGRQVGARRSLRPKMAVPRHLRLTLVTCCVAMSTAWSLGGLFQSLGPTIAAQLFHNENRLFSGLVVTVLVGTSAVVSVGLGRFGAVKIFYVGATSLVVGSALTALAVTTEQLPLFFVASAAGGVGFGATFLGAFKYLTSFVAEEERAGVLSTTFIVIYIGSALPAVIGGALVKHFGLTHVVLGYLAVVSFMAVVSAGTFAMLVRTHRTSPPVSKHA